MTLTVDRGERAVLTRLRGSVLIEADQTNVVLRDVRLEGDSDVTIDRGDFDVELAENLPLTIDAELSSRVDLNSDLPVTLQQNGDRFRGSVNGGAPERASSPTVALCRIEYSALHGSVRMSAPSNGATGRHLSITVRSRNAPSRRSCCAGRGQCVCLQADSFAPQPIPKDLLKEIERAC